MRKKILAFRTRGDIMTSWINAGNEIPYDWYEIRCQIDYSMNLKVYLNGLKNQENDFCINFGQVLIYQAIDEGWDLNPYEYSDSFQNIPIMKEAVLIELTDSKLSKLIEKCYSQIFHHYQILGINFGVDIVTQGIPTIEKHVKR